MARITARSLAPIENGRVRIDVRGRGAGISAANQAKLLTRFFTTERDRGGTGLAIVRAVAGTRGGSVRCTSAPEGTTFSRFV